MTDEGNDQFEQGFNDGRREGDRLTRVSKMDNPIRGEGSSRCDRQQLLAVKLRPKAERVAPPEIFSSLYYLKEISDPRNALVCGIALDNLFI